jgi:hypothetical protein
MARFVLGLTKHPDVAGDGAQHEHVEIVRFPTAGEERDHRTDDDPPEPAATAMLGVPFPDAQQAAHRAAGIAMERAQVIALGADRAVLVVRPAFVHGGSLKAVRTCCGDAATV